LMAVVISDLQAAIGGNNCFYQKLVSILYKLSGISGQLTTNFLDTELTFKYKL